MTFAERLRADVVAAPMTVAAYIARCNAHYYATRDPIGTTGDFVTAPEISQMFGELVGAWLAEAWDRCGRPERSRLVELGPGRGTMMADMRRTIAAAKWNPAVVFVETSPALAAAQARTVPDATTTAGLAEVADDAPIFVVANEFFDALPVRQVVATGDGWRERVVVATDSGLAAAVGPTDVTALVPPALAAAPQGSVVEVAPAATAIAAEIGARLRRHGGGALIIDYGHVGPVVGDTLQAVSRHARADLFTDPGAADLTAHVDFTALAVAAGVKAWGPVGQGDFLRALGIGPRAAALKTTANQTQSAAIDAAVHRLTGAEAMGELFKVMALTRDDVATAPPGFA